MSPLKVFAVHNFFIMSTTSTIVSENTCLFNPQILEVVNWVAKIRGWEYNLNTKNEGDKK